MTNYKVNAWKDKDQAVHFEVHSLSEALVQFAYDYEDWLKDIDNDKQDLTIEIKWRQHDRKEVLETA